MNKTFFQKLENLPVPILPTMVGASTLGTVYANLGFTWIKHITMFSVSVIMIVYSIKIFVHNKTVLKEYSNTVPASLYAGFTMLIMILGSYIFDFNVMIGKTMWFFGLILHFIHILVFTYRNVIKGVNIKTFLPTWFVTYNGIMVSTVVGVVMNEPFICKIVVYYGVCVFALIIPFMIYRLKKHPIDNSLYHTQAVVLAPSSLCLVGYINFIKEPNMIFVYLLYFSVLCALLFIIYKIPKFFSFEFHPGFSALTFPMAIGIIASTKMSGLLISQGYDSLGNLVKQISGIQIYMTTAIISFVLYNFARILVKSYKNN